MNTLLGTYVRKCLPEYSMYATYIVVDTCMVTGECRTQGWVLTLNG